MALLIALTSRCLPQYYQVLAFLDLLALKLRGPVMRWRLPLLMHVTASSLKFRVSANRHQILLLFTADIPFSPRGGTQVMNMPLVVIVMSRCRRVEVVNSLPIESGVLRVAPTFLEISEIFILDTRLQRLLRWLWW